MRYPIFLLICVIVSGAQIVMKFAAESANASGRLFSLPTLALVGASFSLSVVGQLLWFYVLRSAPLSTSYLFLSLVFAIVPFAGWWLFAESLNPAQIVSAILILTGVAILSFA